MNRSLVQLVRRRANDMCEYCGLPQDASVVPFEIDHIIALKHRGPTVEDNLALSCFYCNSFKGTDIASIDPETDELTRLFHPRRDRWMDHFNTRGEQILATTAVGRVKTLTLSMNNPEALRLRRILIELGTWPR